MQQKQTFYNTIKGVLNLSFGLCIQRTTHITISQDINFTNILAATTYQRTAWLKTQSKVALMTTGSADGHISVIMDVHVPHDKSITIEPRFTIFGRHCIEAPLSGIDFGSKKVKGQSHMARKCPRASKSDTA